MTINHLLPCTPERRNFKAVPNHAADLFEVFSRIFIILGAEEHSFLKRGEGIDVFDILDSGGQMIQRCLIQSGQRKVRGRQSWLLPLTAPLQSRFQFFLVPPRQFLHRRTLVHLPAVIPEHLQPPLHHRPAYHQLLPSPLFPPPDLPPSFTPPPLHHPLPCPPLIQLPP